MLGVSLGTGILLIGLLLWYSFYFVDRWWYHPLLTASVRHAESIEKELLPSLPQAGLTAAITAGSPYKPSGIVARLGPTDDQGEMHSDQKMVWFYRVGGFALLVTALLLQAGATFSASTPKSPDNVVKIQLDPTAD